MKNGIVVDKWGVSTIFFITIAVLVTCIVLMKRSMCCVYHLTSHGLYAGRVRSVQGILSHASGVSESVVNLFHKINSPAHQCSFAHSHMKSRGINCFCTKVETLTLLYSSIDCSIKIDFGSQCRAV